MFVRTKILPNGKTKIQIVESFRESGKVRQRILRHVGTVSTASDIERFKQMAEYIKADQAGELELRAKSRCEQTQKLVRSKLGI